jgi:hypothetical protein
LYFISLAPVKGVNVDGVGTVNGVNIYEYDLDTGSEDKPWRKPGDWIFILKLFRMFSTECKPEYRTYGLMYVLLKDSNRIV